MKLTSLLVIPTMVLALLIIAAGLLVGNATHGVAGTSLDTQGPGQPTVAVPADKGQTEDPWPKFSMVFREENYHWETGQVNTFDVWRYTYQGRKNWRLELVESSRDPRAVGSWTSYDGMSYSVGGMVDGSPLPVETQPVDRDVMATWWLVPVSPQRLGLDPKYRRVESNDPSKIHLRQDVQHPCSELSGEWQARLCADGRQSYDRAVEKSLSTDHGIPTEIIERVEDKVTSRIAVTELTLQ
ncbi:MAG TPA: hypothetical protein VF914_10770 [Chloroflexia bacterium]